VKDVPQPDLLGELAADIEHVSCESLEVALRVVSWLAHYINNPLGVISGNVELMAKRLERDVVGTSELQTYLTYVSHIQSEISRCSSTILDILKSFQSRLQRETRVELSKSSQESERVTGYPKGLQNNASKHDAETNYGHDSRTLSGKSCAENAHAGPSRVCGISVGREPGSDSEGCGNLPSLRR